MHGKIGKFILISTGILILGFIVWLTVYLFSEISRDGQVAQTSILNGWKKYQDQMHGFEFRYPADYYLLGDLVPDKKTGVLDFDPAVINLNKGMTNANDSKEIMVRVRQYDGLTKTIAEACANALKIDPTDKECKMRTYTQEDISEEYRQIEKGLISADSSLVVVGDRKGYRTLYLSHQTGIYYALFKIFDEYLNVISIEIPIGEAAGAMDKKDAVEDPRNKALEQIVSTFSFVR